MSLYVYLQVFWYISGGRDDTFISLWSAYGVSHGYGFVNYNMEPLEVSSSFLHVLVLTVLWWANPDLVYLFNKLFGLIMGIVTFVVIIRSSHILFAGIHSHRVASMLVVLLLICSPVWMYWTVGGLENSLVSLILICMAVYMIDSWQTSSDRYIHIGICAAFMCLVRSEGIFYIGIIILFGLAKILVQGAKWQSVVHMLLIPLTVFIALTLWRWISFEALFPNPTYAKVNSHKYWSRALTGWQYLLKSYTHTPLHTMIWPVLIGFFGEMLHGFWGYLRFKKHPLPALFWGFLIIITNHFFVVFSGGDWMEYARFVQPVVPLMLVIFVYFLCYVISTQHTTISWYYQTPRWLVVGTSAYMFIQLQREWGTQDWQATIATPALVTLCVLLSIVSMRAISRWNATIALYGVFAVICLFMILPRHEVQHGRIRSGLRCSQMLDLKVIQSMNPTQFQQHLLEQNCAHGRDMSFINSFINPHIDELSTLFAGNIVMMSKQGGFVPYYIKTQHPDINFYFVDEFGLNDPYIPKLKQKYGNSYMKSREWRTYVESKNVNFWYMLTFNYEVLKKSKVYREENWQIIYETPNEVVAIPKQFSFPVHTSTP
jgi:hypothetical protein